MRGTIALYCTCCGIHLHMIMIEASRSAIFIYKRVDLCMEFISVVEASKLH